MVCAIEDLKYVFASLASEDRREQKIERQVRV